MLLLSTLVLLLLLVCDIHLNIEKC